MKKVGAIRVSDDACRALSKALEEDVKDLAVESQKVADHSGRKTITAGDVKLAWKVVESGMAKPEASPQVPAPQPAATEKKEEK